jgi:UDP-N-acetyl-2-amino-2-deoxyglucuronate dehydrogenase
MIKTADFGHAIIGCGRVAPNHVDGFRALPGWDIVWACDRDPGVAAEFARRYAVDGVTSSMADVFADARVMSVSVATDHAQHAEIAVEALRAGKHVLVEKPLALTVADAQHVLDTAMRHKRILSVVSQHRYDPLVTAARDWLRDGLLGKVLFAQVSLECSRGGDYYSGSYWRGTWRGEGGSALINQGYHCLDVTRLVLGELDVVAAIARNDHLGGLIETEDTLSALLLAGTTPVTLNVTTGSTTQWRTRLEIVGSNGTACFDLDHPATLHRVEGNPELEKRAAMVATRVDIGSAPGIDYYGMSHRRQIADFARAVAGLGELSEHPATAIEMVRLLEGIYKSSGIRSRVS